MSIIIALIIAVAAILVITLIALGIKQRKEKRADARHGEAEQMRTTAKATNLAADRHAARPRNEPPAPSARASQPTNNRWQPQRNAPPRKTSRPVQMRSTPTCNNADTAQACPA